MNEPGRVLTPVEALVKGLRKAVTPDVEWIDANIVRLLLDRYDSRDGAVDEAMALMTSPPGDGIHTSPPTCTNPNGHLRYERGGACVDCGA